MFRSWYRPPWEASLSLFYGGVLVLVGGLVLADLIAPSTPVDDHALRWHVFIWDPWFLVWGMALGLAAWRRVSRCSVGG
jgi:hypothetical protein